jgi:hypothetical protein
MCLMFNNKCSTPVNIEQIRLEIRDLQSQLAGGVTTPLN